MSDICLCYFKFKKPTSTKSFFRYRVKNLANYNRDIHQLNNQVRYKIISNFQNHVGYDEKMFAYSDKNKNYIYTYEEIKFVPDLSENQTEIELVDNIEIPVAENTDLYSAWIEYYVYRNISKLKKYDCHEENNFYLDIDTPKNNLNIKLRRKFYVKTEVMPDGTSYIGFDISTEYSTESTIYDYMKQGKNIVGMEVKCKWQGYNETYKIVEVLDKNINETSKSGLNIYNYWLEKSPYRLKGIDPNNTKIVIVYDKKHGNSKYIPQSLVPVFRRETIATFDSIFSKATDRLTKLPMNKRLEIMQDFISDLNSKTNGIVISEPATAEELGYSVYNTAYNAPKLLISSNRKITINEKHKAFSNGFYRLPNDKLYISFMYFEEKHIECSKAAKVIIDYLKKGKINNEENKWLKKPLIPAEFTRTSYPYKQNYDKLTLKETAKEISRNPKTNFVICFVPMENDDDEYSPDKQYYDIFKKVFADINMPSQMISLKKFNNSNNIKSYLQNIALGILGKSGGIPWIFAQPFSDVDCFVGIDVGMQSTGIHYPACSVCFDGTGNLLGYYKTEKAQSGEKINTKILADIFDKILIEYKSKNGDLPKHIVVHRDGFSNEADEWYEEYFSSKSIKYDLVEVKKNISERLIDKSNLNGMNPDAGICVIKDNEAIIVTTQRDSNYGGAPQPLKIVHKHGSLTMNEIVRQIYALSELHVGSIKSTRLPMTTYYADRICKAGEYIPRGNVYNKLYFL